VSFKLKDFQTPTPASTSELVEQRVRKDVLVLMSLNSGTVVAGAVVLLLSLGVYYFIQSRCSESDLSIKFKDDFVLGSMMAASSPKFSAFVLGGTGAVGKGIVKALASSTGYDRVTLIGRRIVELPPSNDVADYSKFDQKVMDFENISEQSGLFSGYDVGFYAIGVSSAKVSEAEYKKVELENALAIADAIKEGGSGTLKHLHWVSGQSAGNSLFLFGRVKGQVDKHVGELGIPRVSIYRPGGVLSSDQSGMMGSKTQAVMKAIDFGNCLTIDNELMGKAIVANTFREAETPYEILQNKDIQKLGKAIETK